MNSAPRKLLAFSALLAFALVTPGTWLPGSAGSIAFAQGSASTSTPDPNAVSVELGVDEQSPGNTATVPMGYHAPDNIAVGKIVTEITYPGKILIFEEVRRDLAAEAANAEVSAKPGASSGDNSTIEVTIAAKGTPLKQGPQVIVLFKVSTDVKEEMTVPLKNKPQAFSNAATPAPLQPVTAVDGSIHITMMAPAPACFFYMH